MKLGGPLACAVVLTVPVMLATPSEARTAFQEWAQGRGVYVTSKDRLSTWQNDLADLGLAPPPPSPYADPYRRPVPPPAWEDDDGGY